MSAGLRALAALLASGCMARPQPDWRPPDRLDAACRDLSIPRRSARAAQSLRAPSDAQVRVHAWTEDEIADWVGVAPEGLVGLALVHLTVEVGDAPLGSIRPELYLELGEQQWEPCTRCSPKSLSRMVGEYKVEQRPIPEDEIEDDPPPSRSSRLPRPRSGKSNVGEAIGTLVALPLLAIIGLGKLLGSIGGNKTSRKPKTRSVAVWGGELTERLTALAHPPECVAEPGAPCTVGGFFERSHDPPDPVVHGWDQLSVALVHVAPGGCEVPDVASFSIAPEGETLTDRLTRALPESSVAWADVVSR